MSGLFHRLSEMRERGTKGRWAKHGAMVQSESFVPTYPGIHSTDPRCTVVGTAGGLSDADADMLAAEHNAMGPMLYTLRVLEGQLRTAQLWATHHEHDEVCRLCRAEDALSRALEQLARLDASQADTTGEV